MSKYIELTVEDGKTDAVVEQLANAGLVGLTTDVDLVLVTVPPGDDVDDLLFEIGWYADRLSIVAMRVGPSSPDSGEGDR